MKCRAVFALVLLLAAGLSAQGPPAAPATQQPSVTFKSEVDYVEVDAAVTDEQGNPIQALTRDDFEILEDGRVQQIDLFSHVDLRAAADEQQKPFLLAGRQLAQDVQTNERGPARLYLIVLDDLNTSAFRSVTVIRSARRFIVDHFAPGDLGAVVYTSGRQDASQDFTSDPTRLLAAIDRFGGRKLRSALFDMVDTYYQQQEFARAAEAARDPADSPLPTNSGSASAGSSTNRAINRLTRGDGYPDRTSDSDDLERGTRALRVLQQLRDLSDFMAAVRGRRKAMLLFSEGIDYPMHDVFGAHDATNVVRAVQEAITAAARGNVNIFAIDPRGLVGMSADLLSLDSPGPGGDAPRLAANTSAFAAEMRSSQESLKTLADATGGFASVNANDPGAAFGRIVKANSSYYVLGYRPPRHPRDGRFHRIEVRVRRPGVQVSARRGYAAPRGDAPSPRQPAGDKTSSELREALDAPMQQSRSLPLAIHAAAFQHSTAVTIELDGSQLRFSRAAGGPAPGVFEGALELSYFGIAASGKPTGGMQRELQLSLRPDTYERGRLAGFRISERLKLPPGRYQLRIGVRDALGGALGTVFSDVTVPDVSRTALTVSGVLVGARTSPLVPTLIGDPSMPTDVLPWPATSRRTFAAADELTVYAEAYVPSGLRDVASVVRMIAEDGTVAFSTAGVHRAGQPGASAAVQPITAQIALADVPAGRYALQIEARGGGRTATAETVVTVVPRP